MLMLLNSLLHSFMKLTDSFVNLKLYTRIHYNTVRVIFRNFINCSINCILSKFHTSFSSNYTDVLTKPTTLRLGN